MSQATAGNYLTFTLEGELYAVNVTKVREVLEYSRITRLPRSADYLRGLINLRGSSVPVVDLRRRFGFPEAGRLEGSSIIVLELAADSGQAVVGALADQVHEVVELADGAIESAPRFGSSLSADFIRGVARRNEDFVIILDVDRILAERELAELAEAAG